MPTYDYQCRLCGHTVEVIHPMSENGPTACERCGGPLRRVLFPAGIIFKGSGFYKTDSRSGSSANRSDGKSGAAPDGIPGASSTTVPEGAGKAGSGTADAGAAPTTTQKGSDASGSATTGSKDPGSRPSTAKSSGAKEG